MYESKEGANIFLRLVSTTIHATFKLIYVQPSNQLTSSELGNIIEVIEQEASLAEDI